MHRNMSVLIVLTMMMTTATVTFNTQAEAVLSSNPTMYCSWWCCSIRGCDPYQPSAFTLEARIKKGERTVDNYITLGLLYSQKQNFSLAEISYQTALKIATAAKDKQGEARAYAALGYLYADTKQPDKAVLNFKQSRDRLVALGDTEHANEIQQQMQQLQQRVRRKVVPLN